MRTLKYNLIGSITLYDSIKDMPQERYHEFQKLAMQDFGIGSDFDAVNKHHSVLYELLASGKTELAMQEIKNINTAYFLIINNISLKSYCFAALVHSINGNKIEELNDEVVKKIQKKLLKVPHGKIIDLVDEVKKKLITSFDTSFLISSPMLEP